MKENLYKTMMFFCKKEFNALNFTSEERLFIRQYKMMGMADPDQVPTNLTEGNLEHIEQRALAADLGFQYLPKMGNLTPFKVSHVKIINAKNFLLKNYPVMYIITLTSLCIPADPKSVI
jgi:hypothetical protein